MDYDAFISYSHAADGALAPALQSALHKLARPLFRLRALRVFRDQTSLSASPELWPAIEAALRSSRYFLLLASPAASQSKWVQREIAWWLANRSTTTLLVLVTDGVLTWDEVQSDFDWSQTDCLPQGVLQGCFPSEPLWVDLRWARTGETLTLRHVRFRQAVLDVAAPVHGVDKDRLDGEDVQRMARVRRLTALTVSMLLMLTVAALLSFFDARRQRGEAERRGVIAEARRLASQADLARVQGEDPDLPTLLAAEGVRRLGSVGAQELTVDVALRRALAAAPLQRQVYDKNEHIQFRDDGSWAPTGLNVFRSGATLKSAESVATGDCRLQLSTVIAATARGEWCVTELSGRLLVHKASPEKPVEEVASIATGSVHPQALKHISPDGQWLAVDEEPTYKDFKLQEPRRLRIWRTATGEEVHREEGARFFAFAPNSAQFATSIGLWAMAEAAPHPARILFPWRKPPTSLAFSRNGRRVVLRSTPDDEVELWSIDRQTIENFIPADPGAALAVDNDGAAVMVGSRKVLQILSRDGKVIGGYALEALAASFTPDGPRVVVATRDKVRVVDLPPDDAVAQTLAGPGLIEAAMVTREAAYLFVREEVAPGAWQFRLERWNHRTGDRKTLYQRAGMTDVAVSSGGHRWALLSEKGRALSLGDTTMSVPPIEVVDLNAMDHVWIAPSGDSVATVEGRQLSVRNAKGSLRWLSPPDGWVPLAMLSSDGRYAIGVVHKGESKGFGLDTQQQWWLHKWTVGTAASQPDPAFALGFFDRSPDSLCFVRSDGEAVRQNGRWVAMNAQPPLSAADLQDRRGCVESEPHGLEFVHRSDVAYIDILKNGNLQGRLANSAGARSVVGSSDGEVALVHDNLDRLRIHRLSADGQISQACDRKLRELTRDEVDRYLGADAATDVCGRRLVR